MQRLQKSGKFAGDVTLVRERKGKVRVIDKVSNVTLKYRSGEREKGLAAMVVVVRRACRVPDLFSRSVSSRLIYHSATRSAGTCMHAHACALMHESCVTPRAHVINSFLSFFLLLWVNLYSRIFNTPLFPAIVAIKRGIPYFRNTLFSLIILVISRILISRKRSIRIEG